jgi:hypothetical protein
MFKSHAHALQRLGLSLLIVLCIGSASRAATCESLPGAVVPEHGQAAKTDYLNCFYIPFADFLRKLEQPSSGLAEAGSPSKLLIMLLVGA